MAKSNSDKDLAPTVIESSPDPIAPVTPGKKRFTVRIPKDKLAPVLTVEAVSGADAKEVYMAQAGIIASEHPLEAIEG